MARILIVGAGLYGATMARQLTYNGHDVLVIERRSYVGGQVHTVFDADVGCHVHEHGPHIFRTSNDGTWKWVNQFADFNRFVNRPKVVYRGRLFSFPINLMTLNQVFGCTTPDEARKAIADDCVDIPHPSNMEEWCLSKMGRTLYSFFIEGYTAKQWGRHPTELPATLLNRLPIRLTFDDNYYKGNPHQGIPKRGYTAMVWAMLDNIHVELEADYLLERRLRTGIDLTIYSGAIDEFFGYAHGVLDYRTMRWETKTFDREDYQGNAVINHTAAEVPFTRVIEHKHFDLVEGGSKTVVSWEYPEAYAPGKDATYPLRTAESKAMYDRYVAHAAKHAPNVMFGGRLGTYSYLDMDQVISSALAKARAIGKA